MAPIIDALIIKMNTVGGGLEKRAMGEQNEQRIWTRTVHWSSLKKY